MTVQALERKLKRYEEPVKHPLLRWLYLHLPPQAIANRKMHHAYAETVSVLLHEREMGTLTPSERRATGTYLNAVLPFIGMYEKREFPVPRVSPEEMLRFLMEQNGLTQYDLAKDLGGQPVVSDVLRGKRKLTREHIERLGKRFGISPATFYPAA